MCYSLLFNVPCESRSFLTGDLTVGGCCCCFSIAGESISCDVLPSDREFIANFNFAEIDKTLATMIRKVFEVVPGAAVIVLCALMCCKVPLNNR